MMLRPFMWRGLAVFLVAGMLLYVFAGPTEDNKRARSVAIKDLSGLLVEATLANGAHDIEFEGELLDRADAYEGSAEDRASVERRLAVLDWKYHARFEPARARLMRSTEGVEPAKAWIALARMEQAGGTLEAAHAAARKATEKATKTEDLLLADLALSRAAVGRAVLARLDGKPAVDDALLEVFGLLKVRVASEPGLLEPSRLLLQAALLLGREEAVIAAWRSYYHAGAGGPFPNAVEDAGRRLEVLLPSPNGKKAEPIALIRALADSKFFMEAALSALDPDIEIEPKDRALVQEIVAYARFLQRIRSVTEAYYRLTSLGEGSEAKYRADLTSEARRFFEESGLRNASAQKVALEDLQTELRERYGAVFNLGKTAGYFDLHMGHAVVDRRRKVEQYGRSADVRFMMLDNIVSNGFQSWAWEDGAQHGGWGGSTLIVQIRPAYVDGPLDAWRQLHDLGLRNEFNERKERETAGDDGRAIADQHGYLPGLALRLREQGTLRVLDRVRAGGLEGEALRMAFLAENERVVQESSIFAHEGRHAIDASGFALFTRGWKKEFNAKLSEVAFAPEPRLALGGIISSTIGSDNAHGRANTAIMKGLVDWMDKHRADIEGLDKDRPLLPQFDRLTDDQIRAAFRSMDLLAG